MNWNQVRLRDVAELAIGPFGSSLKADQYVHEGIPLVTGGNLGKGRWPVLDEAPCVTESVAQKLSRSVAQRGDLIFPHRGAIGRVAIADRTLMLSTSMMRARIDESRIEPEFAYWFFLAEGSRELLTMSSSVGTPGIGQPLQSLGSVSIRFPEVKVQRAIVGVLGALDDKITANRRAIETGRELLLAWWVGAQSSSAAVRFLRDVTDVSPKVAKTAEPQPAYIEMKSLPENGLLIDRVEHRESKGGVRFMNDDTLIARITPCFENGKMGFVDVLADGEIGYGSTEYIVFRAKEGVPRAVPYAIAASEEFRTFAARTMIGTSGRQRVQAASLGEFHMPWPNDAALREFGEFSDVLLHRLGAARDENLRLAATRDELLPLLMSGKITVKDAEKTVEEVV